jgi:hypothetical protein
MKLDENDLQTLKRAVDVLEHPTLTAKITDLIGMPIEKAFETLPENWSQKVGEITQLALRKSLELAIDSMDLNYKGESSNGLHKLLTGVSGAIGGAFGITALSIELPVSTTIMLRSIADIARSEGENLNEIETKLACLSVFALGGNSKGDDNVENGYYAVRAILAKTISEASKFIAEKGLTEEGAPILVRLITKIATRYEIQVSEKAAFQAIPIIGAAAGAVINLLFTDHFQSMAWGHFTIRRLEKKYNAEFIKSEYNKIKDSFK